MNSKSQTDLKNILILRTIHMRNRLLISFIHGLYASLAGEIEA